MQTGWKCKFSHIKLILPLKINNFYIKICFSLKLLEYTIRQLLKRQKNSIQFLLTLQKPLPSANLWEVNKFQAPPPFFLATQMREPHGHRGGVWSWRPSSVDKNISLHYPFWPPAHPWLFQRPSFVYHFYKMSNNWK